MRTSELLIVFGALMAIIALVAVAIDWVGKPLRNRAFVPRIYRYSDEIPSDMPDGFAVPASSGFEAPYPPAIAPAPAPASPAPPAAHLAPQAPPLEALRPQADPAAVPAVAAALAPPVPPLEGPAPERARRVTTAFSDSVDPLAESDGARIASTVPVESADTWDPGMALDSRVRDQLPTPAEKAERFWKTFADRHGADSHFDQTALSLMADGKAPRRRNPRNGSIESVELVGLRAASQLSDVRMIWPDESADPWSGA